MIFSIIFTALLFLATIIYFILAAKGKVDLDSSQIDLWIVIILIIVFLVIIPVSYFKKQGDIDSFNQEKAYIESLSSEEKNGDIILQRKMELNEWLFKAQFEYKKVRFFTFYDSKIMELDRIN